MGDAYIIRRGGGSGGVNYRVKAYPHSSDIPSTAKENTIAVVTTNEITDICFSPNEPTVKTTGLLWIKVGSSSPAKFNAIKKNSIILYPLYAKLYIGGKWISVVAKSYLNGVWVNWIIYAYNYGDECIELTGGWTSDIGHPSSLISLNKGPDSMTYTGTWEPGYHYGDGIVITNFMIDVTSYSKIKLTYNSTVSADQMDAYFSIQNTKQVTRSSIKRNILSKEGNRSVSVIDLSDVNQPVYIAIGSSEGGSKYTTSASVTILSIEFEQ